MQQPGFAVHQVRKLVSDEQMRQFENFAVSNLSDALGRHCGGARLRPYHQGVRILGRALTVKTIPGDNLMVHKAIDMAAQGDVIVVDAAGDLYNAIIGELMTTYARSRHVAGFVVDGAVRDSQALAKSPFAVFARGVSHRGPSKQGPGQINVPVNIDGMAVMPGDLIVGDADGVVAISPAMLEQVAEAVQKIEASEQVFLDNIANGTLDRAWVDEALRLKGVPGF